MDPTAWSWLFGLAAALAFGCCLVAFLTVRVDTRPLAAVLCAAFAATSAWSLWTIVVGTGRLEVGLAATGIALGMMAGGYSLAAALLAQVRVNARSPELQDPGGHDRVGVALIAPVEPPGYRFSLVAEELTDLADAGVELPPFPVLPLVYASRRSDFQRLGGSEAASAAQRVASRLQARLNLSDPRFGQVVVALTEGRPRLTDAVARLSADDHDRVIVINLAPGEAFRSEKAFAELDEARPEAHGITVTGADDTWVDDVVPAMVAQRVDELPLGPGPSVGILLLALGRPREWDALEPEGARQENYVLQRTRSLLIEKGHDGSRVLPAYLSWGQPDAAEAIVRLRDAGCDTVILAPTTIPLDGVATLLELHEIAERARADGMSILQLPAWGDDPRVAGALYRSVTGALGDSRKPADASGSRA